jgi:hypothetical protein
MIAPDRLDADVLSALRSLMSGFPSLQRARETTQRFISNEISPQDLDQARPETRERLTLLRSLHRVLTDYENLGVAAHTMLHDIPLLIRTLKSSDLQIRTGHGFQGLD